MQINTMIVEITFPIRAHDGGAMLGRCLLQVRSTEDAPCLTVWAQWAACGCMEMSLLRNPACNWPVLQPCADAKLSGLERPADGAANENVEA
mmetsp:Transcript_27957/g.48703  ORF Transcript_27957/g.48703 Transcript_27957/m.48703 type:complete len:92 (-) Transcript_27957:2329-2604(-)